MKLIDLHCDTIGKLMDQKDAGDLMKNRHSISIEHMEKAGTKAQFFACFTCFGNYENGNGYEDAYQRAEQMIAYAKEQFEIYQSRIRLARSWKEIVKNTEEGRISAILTIEEGGVLNGRMERLTSLYQKGVRLMTLMWNYENCLGHPNSWDAGVMEKGLTPFGIETVTRMGELGIIADVSHASDGTFRDILKYAKGPVVASHSNCRNLCNHPRNLTDEMIRALAEQGGVAGLNFFGPFLGTTKESKIEEMTAHILHMIQVGGSEFPAIGTDFDGIDGLERLDIPNASAMELLWEALKKKGLSQEQLDKIWGGNVERVLREVLA